MIGEHAVASENNEGVCVWKLLLQRNVSRNCLQNKIIIFDSSGPVFYVACEENGQADAVQKLQGVIVVGKD